LPWEKFSQALSGSLDLAVLLKVILHVVALVPMTLMSRLFKKCKWLLTLITDGHTLKNAACVILRVGDSTVIE